MCVIVVFNFFYWIIVFSADRCDFVIHFGASLTDSVLLMKGLFPLSCFQLLMKMSANRWQKINDAERKGLVLCMKA